MWESVLYGYNHNGPKRHLILINLPLLVILVLGVAFEWIELRLATYVCGGIWFLDFWATFA